MSSAYLLVPMEGESFGDSCGFDELNSFLIRLMLDLHLLVREGGSSIHWLVGFFLCCRKLGMVYFSLPLQGFLKNWLE